jgi:hypothetical protein
MCLDINTGAGEWITGSIPGSEGSRLAAAGQSREAVNERFAARPRPTALCLPPNRTENTRGKPSVSWYRPQLPPPSGTPHLLVGLLGVGKFTTGKAKACQVHSPSPSGWSSLSVRAWLRE